MKYNVIFIKETKCISLNYHWHCKFSWHRSTDLISVEKKFFLIFGIFFVFGYTEVPSIQYFIKTLVDYSIMSLQNIV